MLSVSLRTAGGRFDHRSTERHYAASTMKLPLLLAAHRQAEQGRLDLDTLVDVRNRFASVLRGTFALDPAEDNDPEVWARLGDRVPLRWLLQRMTVRSSNLATDLALDVVGLDAVRAALHACLDPAAAALTIGRGIEDAPARAAGITNEVGSAGLAAVLAAIAADVPASATTCRAVLDVLAANESTDDIRAGTPAGTWIAHKNGWVDGVVHDAALVRPLDAAPYVLVVCTTTAWPAERAHAFVADVSALCWQHRGQG